MSDEEIRDLLDLGVEDLDFGPPIEAGDTWAAGRRIRTRRSWGVGLGAVAAAAAVVGVVWTQGLAGGDGAPQPPADGTLPEPTLLGTPSEQETSTETMTSSPSDDERSDEGPSDDSPSGEDAEEPSAGGDLPPSAGAPIVVMSEGEWAPSGELTPLTAEETEGRRWFQVDINRPGPTLPGGPGYGLDFDGSSVHVRECSVDVTVPGDLRDGVFVATGDPQWVDDPDPGFDCPVPVDTGEWVQILTGEPRISTDGEILVIAGAAGETSAEPAGLALVPEGVQTPQGGPTTAVTPEDLAAGLREVPGDTAAQDVGVSDVRDPQPEHVTTISMEDGTVTVDVGCAEPLRGPAWFSHVGPEDLNWQLTAALPAAPECDGPAAQDAELWRQMLAHGAFLHHFGDYVIVDSLAEPTSER